MTPDHPKINYGKTGILIVNLGTPDSTNWLDIRKYLKEFLSDRRVIEVNPLIWQVILNLFILTFRPSKTAHAYKKIWRKDTNESPLLYFTKQQSQKLSKKINQFVDATISGGNLKAQSGDLSIFIGGNKKTVNKLKFVFNILGKNIYYLNKPGAGYAAKIAQVSLCYLNYLSLSEALMLGTKSGIRPQTMLQIIDKSASGGYTSTRYGPNMINGDYDPSFFLGLSMKDLNLANEIIKLQKLKLKKLKSHHHTLLMSLNHYLTS